MDSALSQTGDLFGLFQSCTHLTTSRSSTGVPILPKWPVQVPQRGDEHSMLTTCVASVGELDELLQKALHLLNMAMRPAWGSHLGELNRHLSGYSALRLSIRVSPFRRLIAFASFHRLNDDFDSMTYEVKFAIPRQCGGLRRVRGRYTTTRGAPS